MSEKVQEIIIAIVLILAVLGFMAWNLWSELEVESEQEQFGQIIESTWNKEFNQEKVLTAPIFE